MTERSMLYAAMLAAIVMLGFLISSYFKDPLLGAMLSILIPLPLLTSVQQDRRRSQLR